MIEQRTWTMQEVINLITMEIQACRQSENPLDRKSENIAEMVYTILDKEGLIDLTP